MYEITLCIHIYVYTMMTRTCPEELATHRVYMNSIDTGKF